MKKLTVLFCFLGLIAAGALGTTIGFSIWANRPRGVKIDISKLPYDG